MTIVRAYPRLHLSLLDLGGATFRRYGGAGIMLDCMPVEVVVEDGGGGPIVGLDRLDALGQKDVTEALERLSASIQAPNLRRPLRIGLRTIPPQHIGLGTKTALILAILKGCIVHCGIKVPKYRLQALSARGATSGVGIHGFFCGGFVVDAGHPAHAGKMYAPSRFRQDIGIPCHVSRISIPNRWRFGLILPPGRRYAGSDELAFFRRNTPISKSTVQEAISYMYHGVVPAVRTRDLLLLKRSLRALHKWGFKASELCGQSIEVQRTFRALDRMPECAVGLSSMGPLLYTVMDVRSKHIQHKIACYCQDNGLSLLAICKGRNLGCEVIQ